METAAFSLVGMLYPHKEAEVDLRTTAGTLKERYFLTEPDRVENESSFGDPPVLRPNETVFCRRFSAL